jgi:hypothetical protein
MYDARVTPFSCQIAGLAETLQQWGLLAGGGAAGNLGDLVARKAWSWTRVTVKSALALALVWTVLDFG